MQNLEIYCVTNKKLDFLEQTPYKLVGVGEDNFSEKYLKCNTLDNIYLYIIMKSLLCIFHLSAML